MSKQTPVSPPITHSTPAFIVGERESGRTSSEISLSQCLFLVYLGFVKIVRVGYLGRGLKGGNRGGNRTATSAAIFSLEAADGGVAYSGEGRDESRGEEIGALGV